MTFRVTLSETAARQLRKLPSEPRKRIVRGLRVLDILLAPIDELHHDRVLRVGDR